MDTMPLENFDIIRRIDNPSSFFESLLILCHHPALNANCPLLLGHHFKPSCFLACTVFVFPLSSPALYSLVIYRFLQSFLCLFGTLCCCPFIGDSNSYEGSWNVSKTFIFLSIKQLLQELHVILTTPRMEFHTDRSLALVAFAKRKSFSK